MADEKQTGTLKTVAPDGKAPRSRLATADSARSMLSELIRGDDEASLNRTRIQNQIDGFPPFTRAQLEKANQGFVANCNWGGARAKIRDYLTAFHDLVTSSDTFPVIRFRSDKVDAQLLVGWSQIASEEFNDTLTQTTADWSFTYHMELHQKQLAIHGVGPCFWNGPRDWRFRALKRRNILVPKDSPSDPSRLPVVFIRDAMYVTEVFEHIAKKKGEAADRWNYNACIDAIRHAQKKDGNKFSYEQAQERWKDNAFNWAFNESNVVLVAHVFVKEFDGRISHQIFTENTVAPEKATDGKDLPKKDETGYLYSSVGEYEHIGQAAWVCFQDVGNGDFESVRGLGMEAQQFGAAQDRLNNGLINNGVEAGAQMWQAETPEVAQKLTRIEIGPHRMLPTGIKNITVNNGTAIQAQLAVAAHFSQLEEASTGVFRTRASTPSNQARTATEVQAEIGETSKLSNSSVSHYLTQADLLMKETFRRATRKTTLEKDPGGKEAIDFKKRCIARGIPEELFYELCEKAIVTVARPIGNGSYADRVSRINAIGQSIGDMPDRKRKMYVRDRIAYIGGSRELADRYGPDLEQEFPGIEQTLAILENNSFANGGQQDPFSPDGNHELHLEKHLEFAAELLQGDPQAAAAILPVLYHHMGEHLQALEGDPTRLAAFKHYEAEVGGLQNAIKKVSKAAELQAESQRQQSQPSPEMAKVAADSQIKTASAEADRARKDANTAQRMTQSEAKHDQQARQSADKHEQEMRQREQDMEIERRKAAAAAPAK